VIRRLLLGVALVAALPMSACGESQSAHLVLRQATDPAPEADRKSHLAPGAYVNISLALRNLGPGPARGVRLADTLPKGFRYDSLITIGGNAIRTAVEEPALTGDPRWGVWTIPPRTSAKESELVVLFRVQAAVLAGEYRNKVKITTGSAGDVEEAEAPGIVVEPRPALAVSVTPSSDQAMTGGTAGYDISVTNNGSAAARGVTVSAALPAGFLYVATKTVDGNSARLESTDPPTNSLLPVWASWDIPAASAGTLGLLHIGFQVRIQPGVAPGTYSLTTAVTGSYAGPAGRGPLMRDLAPLVRGDAAPITVTKGMTVPLFMTVVASGPYAAVNGTVTYVITVENASVEVGRDVMVIDTLPSGFTYVGTNTATINGQAAWSPTLPAPGATVPRWGPFAIPAGGLNGSTLVIVFNARVGSGSGLGPHPNTVSGSSTNADITGASDVNPVMVTAG